MHGGRYRNILCHICDSKLETVRRTQHREDSKMKIWKENANKTHSKNLKHHLRTHSHVQICSEPTTGAPSCYIRVSGALFQDLIWLLVVFHCIQRSDLPAWSQTVSAVPHL